MMKTILQLFTLSICLFFVPISTLSARNMTIVQDTIPPIDSTALDTFTFFNQYYEEVIVVMTIKDHAERLAQIKRHSKISTVTTFDPDTYEERMAHFYHYDDADENKGIKIFKELIPDRPPLDSMITFDKKIFKEVVWYRYHEINQKELTQEEQLARNQKIKEYIKIKNVPLTDPNTYESEDQYFYHYDDGRSVQVYKSPLPGKEPIRVIETIDTYFYLDVLWYQYEEPKLTKVQEFLTDLSKMEKLDSVTLKTIPQLFTYKKFTRLDIFQGVMDALPESFENLKDLQYLNIAKNQFADFPASIKTLKKITHITAENNKLHTFPEDLRVLKKMNFIKFNDNQISNFPDWLPEWEKLTSLSLTNNQIEELPNTIGNFKTLYTLNLGGNKISRLPDSIDDLTTLMYLNLNDNQLKSLPDNFGLKLKLHKINLSNNQLTSLPDSMAELNDTLKNLDLKGNNFSEAGKEKIKAMLPRCEIEF